MDWRVKLTINKNGIIRRLPLSAVSLDPITSLYSKTVKAIIMNFSEDRDVGIFYHSYKFELNRSTNNGDLLSDRNNWKHIYTHAHTQAHTQTHRLNLILSPYRI